MNGTPKDIDPASDLREDDDEQALPELEHAEQPPGTLAAGRAAITRAVKHAPSSPGVYRMIDAQGDVLYVGKAKNIKKRVTAYTRPTGHDSRIVRMISGTATMEFVSTKTETEALLLEANLIKRLRPRFNVLLRDDKSFPFILITSDHWAPQILKHRGARTRAGHYYGPFANAGAVNRTINALQRAFLLRSCSDSFFEGRTRPCLLHQIKRCSAPCTQEIDFAGYGELVREANEFLSGRSRLVQKELATEMDTASNALDFERAAIYRDRLAALSAITSHQGINPRTLEEADVFAVHQAGGYTCVEVFFFRTGQNWGNRAYFPKADRALGAGEVLSAFPGAVLRRQAAAAAGAGLARLRGTRAACGGAYRQERAQGRSERAATRRTQGTGAACARQCARGAGAQARRYVVATEAVEGADRDLRAAACAPPHRGL